MRQVQPWDDYFLQLCDIAATRSKDPATQVGAVITRGLDLIVTGYNGFPPGVKETGERWERPAKYDRVIHAEQNAIARAAKMGQRLNATTLYTRLVPCADKCAPVIIAAGIAEVVHNGHYFDRYNNADAHDMHRAIKLFAEAGVHVRAHYPACYAVLVPYAPR